MTKHEDGADNHVPTSFSGDNHVPSNGEPLTLEQLREMDGRPAFGVSLINGKPGEWFIIRVVEMSKNWFIACAGASQGFGDKDTYGESWLAYPYPPACIDREKWEPCEECEKSCCNCIDVEEDEDCSMNCQCCVGYNNYRPKFRFCHKCGRPLTPEAWEELERRLNA